MTTRAVVLHGGGSHKIVVEAFNPSTQTRIWTTPKVLWNPGDALNEYVHSGCSLVIREQTEAEREAEQARIAPEQPR